MKKIAIALLMLACATTALACTSAIVSGKLTAHGRPLMWKNRDTGDQNNRLELHKAHDGKLQFVALFDSNDPADTAAWLGMNERGFAIMNTASYNLNGDCTGINMDQEGVVMRRALESCTTVNDFEQLLTDLPKPLGVEANFGVLDANGDAAYFETGNFSWTKFDLKDEPTGILTRTNYSYSGKAYEGYGYIREENACHLLAPHIAAHDITPATFTEELSRTFYHSVLGKDFTTSGDEYLVDQDFIPRRISTASVVFEGIDPGENPLLTTMWISLGYPPCAETTAVWVTDDGVPDELKGDPVTHRSIQCDNVKKRKKEVFDVKGGNGKHYIHLKKLYNPDGTGIAQQMIEKNKQAYIDGYKQRELRKKQLK